MKAPIICMRNASRWYKIKDRRVDALRSVDVDIHAGSITGIIGKSGAGKSTLLRAINGLEKLDEGSVIFDEVDLHRCSRETLQKTRRHIGMIFQHFNLLSRRTVLRNVTLPLEIAGVKSVEAERKAIECLQKVGLEDKIDCYPNQLSGGQKQRVAIARVLVSDVKVLLCDEATSALDSETTRDILHLIKDLNKRLGITVVLIAHQMSIIADICDHVYVLDGGFVVEEGSIEQLFANPRHPVTQSLIQSVFNQNLPDSILDRLVRESSDKRAQVVLRLVFSREVAEKPIIAEFIRECKTDISIVAGQLNHIGSTSIGTLIITMKNDPLALKMAFDFLPRHDVSIEKMGYVECT